ncbi:MAG: prepilin-type N-terminal cleavage/methylation domain-containing protein [Elusimicrobiota bacterium]|jgi:general secretion pathway protein G
MSHLKSKRGFTLIELMIVVAIIGILAAIAIPQFANMVSKSQEGATKGNLGSIRSALSIYYGDNEGVYPVAAASLAVLTTAQKYMQSIPSATLPRTTNNGAGHGTSAAVVNTLGDAGGWYYNNDNSATSTTYGSLVVNCSHNDLKSSPWTSY